MDGEDCRERGDFHKSFRQWVGRDEQEENEREKLNRTI